MADLIEAYIAALYIDKDIEAVQEFMTICFFPRLEVSSSFCCRSVVHVSCVVATHDFVVSKSLFYTSLKL